MARNYRQLARQKARKYGLDPDIFERQIGAESGFNPNARSPAGAQGIAQIMPATARGWGVDPMDPDAALDAAARNMARYVKQLGSYEDALRAYNAGPGAVRASRGYAETNAYVAKILNGRDPGAAGVRPGRREARESPQEPVSREVVDEEGLEDARRRYALQRLLSSSRGPQGSVMQRVGLLPTEAPTAADFTSQETTTPAEEPIGPDGTERDAPRGANGPLYELFWNGPGAVNVKNGQRVGRGFVSGHTNHVHVASDRRTVEALGRLAQQMGLHVGEQDKFGGRPSGGHAPNSYHYRGEAIDVSGDPQKMARFARRVNSLLRGR